MQDHDGVGPQTGPFSVTNVDATLISIQDLPYKSHALPVLYNHPQLNKNHLGGGAKFLIEPLIKGS